MKIWRVILLAMLLVTMFVLSACGMLGSSQKQQEEDYYRRQIEAIQKAQETTRQQTEAYNQQLQQGLNEWAKAYSDWQKQQQQRQLEQVEGMPTENQS